MKRVVNASRENSAQLPITKLTEDEMSRLPDKVTLVTNMPGVIGEPIFKVVSTDKIATDPDKCFMINSYWGYAHGRDVYLASKSDVDACMNREIENVKAQYDKYRRSAL